MRIRFLVAVALLSALLACKGSAREASGTTGTAASESKAGLCEHGVLQEICPKCNPKLAPVFQAKGDWCKEHGFPESVCPICHPERGGRPKVDVSAKGGAAAAGEPPADGTKVRFKTKEIARLAGIETARAEEHKGGGGIPALAKISYDATRLAHVNARSRGVVRKIHVDVGAKVKKGAKLAELDSAEVGADRSRLEAARSRVAVAKSNHERLEVLHDKGLSSTKELLDAKRELDEARAEYAALATALSVVGASGGSGGTYTLVSPLDGIVTRRTVTVGKLVSVEELLFEVVDTSAMWADLDVAERDLPQIAVERPVVLRVDGLEGREFHGTIRYLSPEVDPHTRTVRARVPLENADSALRANMFGQARVLTPERVSVMVPSAAVQRVKTVHLVFVKRAEDEYEARRVELGVREGDRVEIKKGIRPGEDVATQGSFLLKTETLKESIGAGCCDVD